MAKYNDVLVYLRKRCNLTQEEASKKIGISRSSLANYEKGLRRPNFETMEMIADFYNVNMDTIFGHESAVESNFHTQIDAMSQDLWVKQQVAILEEYQQTDTSGMSEEEQKELLHGIIRKYMAYKVAPADPADPGSSFPLTDEETDLVCAWRKAEDPIRMSVRKLLDMPAPAEEKEVSSSRSAG